MDLMNGHIVLETRDNPCTSFLARKFNLTYAKKELLWYIEGNPYSDWIEQYATAWKKLKQPDGTFYSNYGQYLFTEDFGGDENSVTQFQYVIDTLRQDRDSRRACMVLLQPYHLFHTNVDTVCTYAIQFAIYNDTLHMTVMMRSNDAIWGLSNDAFCFWCIYQMMYALLQEVYPELERGTYTHMANSLHIYKRHYEMVQTILDQDLAGFRAIDVPFVTAGGVRQLLKMDGPKNADSFVKWLASDQE
jgi:thymidylate synthase